MTQTACKRRGSELAQPSLARLMTWLSPAFPVGGFSYSHGLEWVVETGKVKDAATLGDWIEDMLVHGAGRTDAIFLAEAWRAAAAGDAQRAARGRRAGRGLRPLGRAPPGNAGAGRRLPRRREGRLAASGAR